MQFPRGANRRASPSSGILVSKYLLLPLAGAALLQTLRLGGGVFVALDASTNNHRDKSLPPWQEGFLDIHHLRVGPSESSFVIFPDGTTMMIDAGDMNVVPRNPPRVRGKAEAHQTSTSKKAVEYIHRFWPRPLEARTRRELDYFLLTHFHHDHMGELGPNAPKSSKGDYRLSGLTEVAEYLAMAKIVDRDHPNYDFPAPIQGNSVANYRRFLQTGHRGTIEKFQVGSTTQFAMKQPQKSPYQDQFRVVNLKNNLDVMGEEGSDATTIHRIPGQVFSDLKRQEWNENEMSSAIRIDYGAFRYYEGADQEAHSNPDGELDAITPTAKAAGKVDVATANHHGRGTNRAFLDELDPRVVILQVTLPYEPHVDTIALLTQPRKSNLLQKQTLLITDVFPKRMKAIERQYGNAIAAMNGHVVVRVTKPGPDQNYSVFMLDEAYRVKSTFGPFKPYRL